MIVVNHVDFIFVRMILFGTPSSDSIVLRDNDIIIEEMDKTEGNSGLIKMLPVTAMKKNMIM